MTTPLDELMTMVDDVVPGGDAELVALLEGLAAQRPAAAPTPSGELALLLDAPAPIQAAPRVRGPRRAVAAGGAVALLLAGVTATGAAANELPDPVQRAFASFSERFLPVQFPRPEETDRPARTPHAPPGSPSPDGPTPHDRPTTPGLPGSRGHVPLPQVPPGLSGQGNGQSNGQSNGQGNGQGNGDSGPDSRSSTAPGADRGHVGTPTDEGGSAPAVGDAGDSGDTDNAGDTGETDDSGDAGTGNTGNAADHAGNRPGARPSAQPSFASGSGSGAVRDPAVAPGSVPEHAQR